MRLLIWVKCWSWGYYAYGSGLFLTGYVAFRATVGESALGRRHQHCRHHRSSVASEIAPHWCQVRSITPRHCASLTISFFHACNSSTFLFLFFFLTFSTFVYLFFQTFSFSTRRFQLWLKRHDKSWLIIPSSSLREERERKKMSRPRLGSRPIDLFAASQFTRPNISQTLASYIYHWTINHPAPDTCIPRIPNLSSIFVIFCYFYFLSFYLFLHIF